MFGQQPLFGEFNIPVLYVQCSAVVCSKELLRSALIFNRVDIFLASIICFSSAILSLCLRHAIFSLRFSEQFVPHVVLSWSRSRTPYKVSILFLMARLCWGEQNKCNLGVLQFNNNDHIKVADIGLHTRVYLSSCCMIHFSSHSSWCEDHYQSCQIMYHLLFGTDQRKREELIPLQMHQSRGTVYCKWFRFLNQNIFK